ncbi:hypothetical protein U1Q18_021891 [Sarracenia purpurea var. burkii]
MYEWSIHEANLSRKMSLAITGVLLHAWCEETFLMISDLWSTAASVDPNTVYKDELEVGRILVVTDHRGIINHQCKLKVDNFIYSIQCFEEPLLDKANPLFCPPKSSPSFFGKAKEVSEEMDNSSHTNESILFPRVPRVPSQASRSQAKKSTYIKRFCRSNTAEYRSWSIIWP